MLEADKTALRDSAYAAQLDPRQHIAVRFGHGGAPPNERKTCDERGVQRWLTDVLDCGGHLQGAVIVIKDLEGNLSVEQTDHMVRESAESLGTVGFAVGRFAPPLLAAPSAIAGVGSPSSASAEAGDLAPAGNPSAADARGLAQSAPAPGELPHHEVSHKLGEQAGATIPIGGAGLIVAYSHPEAEKVEPAVTRDVQKAIGEAEGRHVQALKARPPTRSRRWSNAPPDQPDRPSREPPPRLPRESRDQPHSRQAWSVGSASRTPLSP